MKVGDKLICKSKPRWGFNTDIMGKFTIGKVYHVNLVVNGSLTHGSLGKLEFHILDDVGKRWYFTIAPGLYHIWDYFTDIKEQRLLKLKQIEQC